MKMAQEAQTKLMEAQESLDKVEVEGVSGGGLVRIRASAKGRVISVDIDQSLLQPSEKQMVDCRRTRYHNAFGRVRVATAKVLLQVSRMNPPGESSSSKKPVAMPLWSRILIAIGGAALCVISLAALFTGRAGDGIVGLRVVAGFAIGVGLIVAAIVGRWPNSAIAWLFP